MKAPIERKQLATDEKLNQLLEASPAPRITKDGMESRIASVDYTKLSETVTVCNITLDNGFHVLGESACVNAANYNQEIGERIAYDDAFKKLWPLFGFLLAEANLMSATAGKDSEELRGTPGPQTAGTDTVRVAKLDDVIGAIHERVTTIHKDSGVPSDVTSAVNNAILEGLVPSEAK